MSLSKKKVVIIGAGPSGLAVAWELINKNCEVIILEADKTVGGYCKTLQHEGLTFDIGPHGFSPQIPEVLNKVKNLLGEDFIEKENYHGINFDGITYRYPPKFSDFIRFSPIKNGILFTLSFLYAKFNFLRNKNEETFDNKLINRFGNQFCEKLVFPLVEKAWGTRNLHPEFVDIRMTIPPFSKIIKKIFVKDSKINNSMTFYYPKKGFGQIFDRIFEVIRQSSQTIEFNVNISSIKADSLKGPFKIFYTSDNTEKVLDADYIVSTIPNEFLIKYLSNTGLIDPFISRAKDFHYRNLRLGILLVKGFSLPLRVVFFPERRFLFNRITDMTHFSDLGNPEDHAILMFDFIHHPDNKIEKMSEEDFREFLINSVMELGWFKKEQIVKSFSLQFPFVYPVIDRVRYEVQDEFDEHLEGSNLLLCGREASSDYNNAHNAMAKGFITARYVSGEITFEEYKILSKKYGRMPIGE